MGQLLPQLVGRQLPLPVGIVGRVGRVTLHHGNCHRTIDVKPSILRTRLVPSKFIRRYKLTETVENKVEQATGTFKEVER